MLMAVAESVDPNTPLDWGIITVVVIGLVTSVGQAAKKVITWVTDRITAPDTRVAELEAAKKLRELADQERLNALEETVNALRDELKDMHLDLKESEVARARTEGELQSLKLRYEAYEKRLENMGKYSSMGKFVDNGWLELANDIMAKQYGVRAFIETDNTDEQIALGHEIVPVELLEEYQVPTEEIRTRRALSRAAVAQKVRREAGLRHFKPPTKGDYDD